MTKHDKSLPGRWRGWSIEFKLPATIALLLALLVSFYVFEAYRAVERSALEVAGQRIERVGDQLAQLVEVGNRQRAATINQAQQSPALPAALAGGSRAAADTALARLSTRSDSTAPVMLLDADMKVVAQIGDSVPQGARVHLERAVRDHIESGGAAAGTNFRRSPFFVHDSTAYYWMVAPLTSDSQFGLIAQLRRVANSDTTSSQALRELMGDARVYFANADAASGVWVEIDGTVVDAPEIIDRDGKVLHARADGTHLVHAAAIKDTPWLIVTESSTAAARQRALAFVGESTPVAIAVILIGALLAWFFAHRYVRPMRRLADAANAIAAGDYSQRVHLSGGDELALLAGAFNEMTEQVNDSRAELEERVRQRTAELEAANHELRAFSYSVSHDLRSPLRSMDGFSQALLEDYGPALDETGKDYLSRVRAAAQRMGVLIDDLLQLSRVTLEPLQPEAVDVTALVTELVRDLRQEDGGRTVDVVIESDMTVVGDAGLLRVAFQNLLANAWKFTTGTAAARIEVGRRAVDGGLEFFVRDNGAGFDMAYAGKLFTPFQRLHTAAEFKGTGIGLATVQRVVMRHGGTVRAEGAEGRGATFFMTIPGE